MKQFNSAVKKQRNSDLIGWKERSSVHLEVNSSIVRERKTVYFSTVLTQATSVMTMGLSTVRWQWTYLGLMTNSKDHMLWQGTGEGWRCKVQQELQN